MNRLVHSFVGMLLALMALQVLAQTPDLHAVLQATDRFRMGAVNLQMDTLVSLFNSDGTPEKERRYLVFVQANHKSLVLMQSPAERGQKVLMLGDDFWLLMPGSQRPLRITPMQKLLGDASIGDVATMSWTDAYKVSLVGEEPCAVGTAVPAHPNCLHLSLRANRKGVSYQRIELWVGKVRHEPIRADLYVQSDKLAKQAHFVMDQPEAPTMVTEMVLRDLLSNNKETRVQYLSRKARTLPQTWFNPMFLAQNPILEQ